MKDFTNKHIHANYKKSNRTYIGSLWFYDNGFEYKAKSVNSNIKMGKISYSEINNITPVNTFAIIPNGILVKLKNGKAFNYIISDRKSVIKFLESKID